MNFESIQFVYPYCYRPVAYDLLANVGAGTSVPRPRCVRVTSQVRSCLDPDAFVSRPAFAESHYLFLLNNIYLCNKNELRMQRGIRFEF